MIRPRLLIATTNEGKLREVRAMLAESEIEVLSLRDVPGIPEAVEDGATFEANAAIKALHYHRACGETTLADDSGLEVDALGGAPGVYSARYAGPQCNDADNNRKLIEELGEQPGCTRTARFRCVMAMAHDGKIVATGSGSVEGLILDVPRGNMGFGYDPHFLVPSLGLTKAELPLGQKNEISHRGQALRAILPAIRQFLKP